MHSKGRGRREVMHAETLPGGSSKQPPLMRNTTMKRGAPLQQSQAGALFLLSLFRLLLNTSLQSALQSDEVGPGGSCSAVPEAGLRC